MAITKVSPGLLDLDSGITITTADNTTQLTLISTDADANKGPVLDLYRNSSSPADADSTGRINFQGENSAGETITYSQIFSSILDVTDGTEDGRYKIGTMVAGSFDSRMDMTNTETIFNDDSKDLDFRVESDNFTHALFVQGSDGNVGIGGVSAPAFENGNGLEIRNPTGNGAHLKLTDNASGTGATQGFDLYMFNSQAYIENYENAPTIFRNNGSERMRIQSGGGISFNGDTAAANALDDYEEGTWTPVVKINTSTTGITGNHGGTYTKVGREVTVVCYINFTNKGSTTGNLLIDSLPFNSGNLGMRFHGSVGYYNLTLSSGDHPRARLAPQGSGFDIQRNHEISPISNTNLANNTEIYITLTYFTD